MLRRVVLLVVLLLGAAVPADVQAAGRGRVVSAALAEAGRALERGEDALRLRGAHPGGARRTSVPGRARRPYVRPDGRLQVQVRAAPGADPHALAATLQRLGGRVERLRPSAGLLQATVPPEALDRLAAEPAVAAVRPPRYAYAQAGEVLTLGAGSPASPCLPGGGNCPGGVNAYAARARHGAGGYSAPAGRRIRIGVVSDGVAGLGQSVLSGDLPAGIVTRSFVDPPGDVVQTSDCAPTAEGRALLEIVHDLVPDAQLYFAAVETDLDYIAAVEWLASERMDVVVDDIAFFNAGPYDGSSDVARVRTRAVEAGVTYVGAVGNSGQLHHRSAFAATASVFGFSDVAHEFPGRGLRMPVHVEPRGEAFVFLQWDGTPFERAATDFDLLAFTSETGEELADASDAPQTGAVGETATESVFLENDTDDPQTFWIQIDYCGPFVADACTGSSPPTGVTFRIFVVGDVRALEATDRVEAGSVPNGPDAPRTVTTGAVGVSTGRLRDYSSRGETGVTGDEVKPTVVGPDGILTTVSNLPGLGGGGDDFLGTSAAAPHVAAVAAMVIAADPSRAPDAVRAALIGSASHAGAPDNERGHGLVDAVEAVSSLVPRDPAFELVPLPLPAQEETGPTARAALAQFTLQLASGAAVEVRGVTASVRLGRSQATAGDSGTPGHERADLRQACVVQVGSPDVDLGCSGFGSDDGRLLVLLETPLLVTPGVPVTLRLVYDLDVQPAGTTVVAGRARGAALALAGLLALGVLGRRDGRGRRLVLLVVASLALSCGNGGRSVTIPTCPAPAAADALAASEPVGDSTAAFSIRPLEPGDVIAVRAGTPVVPVASGTFGPRTVTAARP